MGAIIMVMKELMERVGTSNFGFANAYLEDAIRESNMLIEESVATAKTNLVKDQRYYAMESDQITGLVKLLNIAILDTESSEYRTISRVVGQTSIDEV